MGIQLLISSYVICILDIDTSESSSSWSAHALGILILGLLIPSRDFAYDKSIHKYTFHLHQLSVYVYFNIHLNRYNNKH